MKIPVTRTAPADIETLFAQAVRACPKGVVLSTVQEPGKITAWFGDVPAKRISRGSLEGILRDIIKTMEDE